MENPVVILFSMGNIMSLPNVEDVKKENVPVPPVGSTVTFHAHELLDLDRNQVTNTSMTFRVAAGPPPNYEYREGWTLILLTLEEVE